MKIIRAHLFVHFCVESDNLGHILYVNSLIDETLSSEGAVLIHCLASLSRSPAFILSYMMKKKRMTLVEATALFKSKWDACWPADSFVMQLIEYENELGL